MGGLIIAEKRNDRFVFEPSTGIDSEELIFAKTGKGFLISEGMAELECLKASLESDSRRLPIVSGQDASDREVLVQIGPAQTERREFDVGQLLRCPACQSRVEGHRKSDLRSAAHRQHDHAVQVLGRLGTIG